MGHRKNVVNNYFILKLDYLDKGCTIQVPNQNFQYNHDEVFYANKSRFAKGGSAHTSWTKYKLYKKTNGYPNWAAPFIKSTTSKSANKFNNKTLRIAVNEWLEDEEKAKGKYGHISNWDTSEVTDMSQLFLDAFEFNEPLNDWDVSGVKNMDYMFYKADSFNQPIDKWDVSSVSNMSYMFAHTTYNQPIGKWDVSSITNMKGMFANTIYNQDIGNWDVSSVANMEGMFANTTYNQNIGDWDVSSVTNMKQMFLNAKKFNQPIGKWDVSAVINMQGMFAHTTYNQPMCDWDVSSVTSMANMFVHTSFNQPIGKWDVSSVSNMSYMFAHTAYNQPIDDWDVSSVRDMYSMFLNAKKFNQPIGNWDVSSVSKMDRMFYKADLFDQDIGNWDVNSITLMYNMFSEATSFNQVILNWDAKTKNKFKISEIIKLEANEKLKSVELTKLLLATIKPSDVVYAEITSPGGMGNSGGMLLYVIKDTQLKLYTTSSFSDREVYMETDNLIFHHFSKIKKLDEFNYYPGGVGTYVYIHKNVKLTIKAGFFTYRIQGAEYNILSSTMRVFYNVLSRMKQPYE